MEQSSRDLNDMAIFAEIVSAGGISAAAERIGLPKSNVSRRLARLENRLGVQLIERNTRTSRVTPVGQRFADHCRLMLEEATAADDVIAESLAGPSGELRVSASVLVGQYVVAPALSEYTKLYPAVTASISLTNRRVNMIEDGFDLAIRVGKNVDSGLISQTLGICPMRLYASQDYLKSHGRPSVPKELEQHACLIMSDIDDVSHWRLNNAGDQIELALSPGLIINDFASLKTLALDGIGIGLFPDYAVHAEAQTGRLVKVLDDWEGPRTELNAIYPSRRGATPKVRCFIECLRRHVTEIIGQ